MCIGCKGVRNKEVGQENEGRIEYSARVLMTRGMVVVQQI